MLLPTDGTELQLIPGVNLSGSYTPGDGRPGRLTLTRADTHYSDVAEGMLELDPWSPEGYRVDVWPPGDALLVCGASHLTVLRLSSMQIAAGIALEHEECETLGQPRIIATEDMFIISSETRVFCIDSRLAIRWCWSVRAHSDGWWILDGEPTILNDTVLLRLRSRNEQTELKLRTDSGFRSWP